MIARILVTDGEQRTALAAVRSLGAAGHQVFVCSESLPSLAGCSRRVVDRARVPSAAADPSGFQRAVSDLASRWRIDLILPITESALLVLLESPPPGVRVPWPGLEQFRAICDKRLVLSRASSIGIAVPRQVAMAGGVLPEGLPPLRFPVVLKPTRTLAEGPDGRTKHPLYHVSSDAELAAALIAIRAAKTDYLLQDRIVGPGIGVFLLVWEGRLLCAFSHRRIREKPPAGGVSVYRESIDLDPTLLEKSQALLEQFAWSGVAMIEYKVDKATGTPYLMEINGRLWGSLQLAIDAGVDFPRLLAEAALGERPPAVTGYRAGVRSRWWLGDVDHLLARLTNSDAELALPPGSPSRLRAVLDFLTLWRPGDRSEVFRWSDPAPALFELLQWVRGR